MPVGVLCRSGIIEYDVARAQKVYSRSFTFINDINLLTEAMKATPADMANKTSRTSRTSRTSQTSQTRRTGQTSQTNRCQWELLSDLSGCTGKIKRKPARDRSRVRIRKAMLNCVHGSTDHDGIYGVAPARRIGRVRRDLVLAVSRLIVRAWRCFPWIPVASESLGNAGLLRRD